MRVGRHMLALTTWEVLENTIKHRLFLLQQKLTLNHSFVYKYYCHPTYRITLIMCKYVSYTARYRRCRRTPDKHTHVKKVITGECDNEKKGLCCPDLTKDTSQVWASASVGGDCPLCPQWVEQQVTSIKPPLIRVDDNISPPCICDLYQLPSMIQFGEP